MSLGYFEREALRRLVSGKTVPGQIDHLELVGSIDRTLANDELEEVKGMVRSEFGIVEFETATVERAPVLIWRRIE